MIRVKKCSECSEEMQVWVDAPTRDVYICFRCIRKMGQMIKDRKFK